MNENELFGKSVQEADCERLRGAGRGALPGGGRRCVCAGGSWLNQLLAEVTAKPSFSLDRPRRSPERAQDMALKTRSLECPLAPGL